MPLEIDVEQDSIAKIKVIGVGGAGNNAINRMIEHGLSGAEFYAVNTDKQALLLSKSKNKIQIGEKLTSGLGVGGDPAIGKRAAEESIEDLTAMVEGANLVYIAAGLGGGTGTGAGPVIAEIARQKNILTVAVVTMPFMFEGGQRLTRAKEGYETLKEAVDTIVTIPNDKLLQVIGKGTTMLEAFRVADDVLRQGIQGITELIVKPALVNLDFADVRTVMSERGVAHMGIGVGYGDNKTMDAAKQAIQSPLLETSIEGARGILYNVTGDPTMGLLEIEEAANLIRQAADPEANIFFGADTDDSLEDEVRITVIATGFDSVKKQKPMAVREEIDVSDSIKEEDFIPVKPEKKGPVLGNFADTSNDLDIPPFLRRKRTKRDY
ncbi:MAG: cell division protein FtsZ [Christensenellales bacterium]|jgi:cell division protein FtsZ